MNTTGLWYRCYGYATPAQALAVYERLLPRLAGRDVYAARFLLPGEDHMRVIVMTDRPDVIDSDTEARLVAIMVPASSTGLLDMEPDHLALLVHEWSRHRGDGPPIRTRMTRILTNTEWNFTL